MAARRRRAWRASRRPRRRNPEAIDFANASIDALDGFGDDAGAGVLHDRARARRSVPTPAATAGERADGGGWRAVDRGAAAPRRPTPTKLGGALINIGFVPDEEIVGDRGRRAVPGRDARRQRAGDDLAGQHADRDRRASRRFLDARRRRRHDARPVAAGRRSRLRLPTRYHADRRSRSGRRILARHRQLSAAARGRRAGEESHLLDSRLAPRAPSARSAACCTSASTPPKCCRRARRRPSSSASAPATPARRTRSCIIRCSRARRDVQVEEDGGWIDWDEVDGFEASTERLAPLRARRRSRHGALRQRRARTRAADRPAHPRARVPLRRRRRRATSARRRSRRSSACRKVKASNPLPARGGAPAETIADALERVPGELRRHDRAVTAGDFQELALATPGADVGRADCLPLFRPPRNLAIAGARSERSVSGSAPASSASSCGRARIASDRTRRWPIARCCARSASGSTRGASSRPSSTSFRRRIAKIAVAVGLRAKPGYGIEAVRRWVELVLRQYLAPLPPYGPDGHGWPLGPRGVRSGARGGGAAGGRRRAARGPVRRRVERGDASSGIRLKREPVAVCQAWEVPELREITVVQGAPLVPGEALGPVPPPQDAGADSRRIREEC